MMVRRVDGAVGEYSTWFTDEDADPAKGHVKNNKFPLGHSMMSHRPEKYTKW